MKKMVEVKKTGVDFEELVGPYPDDIGCASSGCSCRH